MTAVSSVICAQFLFLESEDPKEIYFLYINSPGGVVSSGLALYDTMQYIRARCIQQYASDRPQAWALLLLQQLKKGKDIVHTHVKSNGSINSSGGVQGQASDIEIHAKEII